MELFLRVQLTYILKKGTINMSVILNTPYKQLLL